MKLPQTEQLLLDSKQRSDRPRKSVVINPPADEELIKHKQLGFIKKLKTFHNLEIQNGKFHVHGRKVGINMKALRVLRVLRPLRSVKAIPSMRRLVTTLL